MAHGEHRRAGKGNRGGAPVKLDGHLPV